MTADNVTGSSAEAHLVVLRPGTGRGPIAWIRLSLREPPGAGANDVHCSLIIARMLAIPSPFSLAFRAERQAADLLGREPEWEVARAMLDPEAGEPRSVRRMLWESPIRSHRCLWN